MDTLHENSENKKEFDDSGVQDVDKQSELEDRTAELLDLSDDVLLGILKYCSPMDLKALGYTCPRLGRLIRDRTLWTRVDARSHRTGRARMRWLLAHALGANTVELKLQGYALSARGCLGHVNRKRKEAEEEKARRDKCNDAGRSHDGPVQLIHDAEQLARLQTIYSHNRNAGTPLWPDDGSPEADPEEAVLLDGSCPGPQFTLTRCMLRQLRVHCSLTSLALEYCNINCNTTGISHFPPTLKKLSLKGSKCYNLPIEKSFLFNIQDYLPEIEYLDLSECEWLEPASLLPLSKVANLKHLIMRECHRLSEFVAYASLSTRYGFRKLEILDVRGSPVGDSEVSAFGWLPALLELYASPARPPSAPRRASPSPRPASPAPAPAPAAAAPVEHAHYRDEPPQPHTELEPWEMQEPEYFKIKPQITEPIKSRPDMTTEEREQLRQYENCLCLHGLEYNLCTEGAWYRNKTASKRPAESSSESQQTQFTQDSNSGSKVIEVSLRGNHGNQPTNPGRPTAPPQMFNVREQDETAGPSKRSRSDYEERISKDMNSSVIDDLSNEQLDMPGCNDPETEVEKKSGTRADLIIGAKRKIFYANARPGSSSGSNTCDEEEPSKKKAKDKCPPTDTGTEMPGSSKDPATVTNEGKTDPENGINDGASTSNESKTESNTPEDCLKPTIHPKGCKCKSPKYEYVRFRQNMDPVIVRRDPAEVEREERDRQMEDREVRPRAHVLYVNVGQQLHTVYRLSIHNEPPIFYSFAGNSHLRFRPNVGNIFYTPLTPPHLEAASLVTDSAIRRFGRADVDDVNVVHIGPRGGAGDPGSRPNRSSLRVLSITGYRNITDRSLVHLATAAPDLRLVDFSETRVTAQGVENFKSLRPDCDVIFSEFIQNEE